MSLSASSSLRSRGRPPSQQDTLVVASRAPPRQNGSVASSSNTGTVHFPTFSGLTAEEVSTKQVEAKVYYMGHAFGASLDDNVLDRMKQIARGNFDQRTKLRISWDGFEFGTKSKLPLGKSTHKKFPLHTVLDMFLDHKRVTIIYAIVQYSTNRFEVHAFRCGDKEPQVAKLVVQGFRELRRVYMQYKNGPPLVTPASVAHQPAPQAPPAATSTPTGHTTTSSKGRRALDVNQNPIGSSQRSPSAHSRQSSTSSVRSVVTADSVSEAGLIETEEVASVDHGADDRQTQHTHNGTVNSSIIGRSSGINHNRRAAARSDDRISLRSQQSTKTVEEEVHTLGHELRHLRQQFEAFVSVSASRVFDTADVGSAADLDDTFNDDAVRPHSGRQPTRVHNGQISVTVPDYRRRPRSPSPPVKSHRRHRNRSRSNLDDDNKEDDDDESNALVLRAETTRVFENGRPSNESSQGFSGVTLSVNRPVENELEARQFDSWRSYQQRRADEIRQQQSTYRSQQTLTIAPQARPVSVVRLVPVTNPRLAHAIPRRHVSGSNLNLKRTGPPSVASGTAPVLLVQSRPGSVAGTRSTAGSTTGSFAAGPDGRLYTLDNSLVPSRSRRLSASANLY